MYLLTRDLTKRKVINDSGRLGYVKVEEVVITEEPANYQKRKRIPFTCVRIDEESKPGIRAYYPGLIDGYGNLDIDHLIEIEGEVVSRNASKYRR